MAQRLGVLPQNVRLITKYVGGAFGARVILWSDTPLAAAAAREIVRPVRLVLTREQMFTLTGHRPQLMQTVRLGASRDGVLNAVSHQSISERPTTVTFPMTPAHATTDALYRTPNLHVDAQLAVLDIPGSRAMRGPNEAPGAFALETAMDELAVATGVDPVELRLRNYATTSPSTGLPWSSKHLEECYRVGARRFGWSARSATPRSRIDGQWLYGTGMATAIYPAHRRAASVRVRLLDDDTAVVSTGISDFGTGGATMVRISGADALGIPLTRVTPEIGDTLLPQGAPAAGSSATHATVPLIVNAARDAIKELKRLAVTDDRSPWHGASADDLHYERGILHGQSRSMTFGRLLAAVDSPGITALAESSGDADPGYVHHSFGAHFCEVRVNRFTGETRVTRFTMVADVGRVINSRAARSQLVGGVIFGIGHALLEENPLELDTGRLASSTLADYLVPGERRRPRHRRAPARPARPRPHRSAGRRQRGRRDQEPRGPRSRGDRHGGLGGRDRECRLQRHRDPGAQRAHHPRQADRAPVIGDQACPEWARSRDWYGESVGVAHGELTDRTRRGRTLVTGGHELSRCWIAGR
ncbi:xanthine dehydrogenase family protein molybdopterin-binding subunit [Streptomyces sp. NPDC001780]